MSDAVEFGRAPRRSRIVALAAMLVAVLGLTTASLVSTSTATAPTWGQLHRLDHTKVKAVVVKEAHDGTAISRHVYYGAKALAVVPKDSGTGGSPSSGGRQKVTISTWGLSTLGFKLWRDKIWLDYEWNRQYKWVTIWDKGKDWTQYDQTWKWEGWIDGDPGNFYDWINGASASGYHKMAQGSWSGPCISSSLTCWKYPKEVLNVHSDGTNNWSN